MYNWIYHYISNQLPFSVIFVSADDLCYITHYVFFDVTHINTTNFTHVLTQVRNISIINKSLGFRESINIGSYSY